MTKFDYLELPSDLRRSVPFPQGPFSTGCADVAIGTGIKGSLIRMFYPSDEKHIKKQPKNVWTSWYLGKKYNEGLAYFQAYSFSFLPNFLLSIIIYISTNVIHFMLKNSLIPAIWEAPITSAKKTVPVVIFSHGLSANRTLYSAICNDLASHGILVAAVEHRDASASATFILTPEGEQKWIPQTKNLGKPNEAEIRTEQITQRAEECSRALDLLFKLNDGKEDLQNLLPSSFDLLSLKGKLDLKNPCIAGHSFGGGTVIKVMDQDQRFGFGVALDPWMFPLAEEATELSNRIKKPILFILMEKFQDEANLAFLRLFENKNNSIYTIRGAVHLHQVDTGMMFSKDWKIIQKVADTYSSSFPPEVPLTINNALILRYLANNLDCENIDISALNQFLEREERHILKGINGTAKSMLGWDKSSIEKHP